MVSNSFVSRPLGKTFSAPSTLMGVSEQIIADVRCAVDSDIKTVHPSYASRYLTGIQQVIIVTHAVSTSSETVTVTETAALMLARSLHDARSWSFTHPCSICPQQTT